MGSPSPAHPLVDRQVARWARWANLPGGAARWSVCQVGLFDARWAVRQVGPVAVWILKSRWHARQVDARWAFPQVGQVGFPPGGAIYAVPPMMILDLM